MDIEKIMYLVVVVVYGLVSIVLSVIRTLKTSRISSEVKSAFPSLGKDYKDDKDVEQSSDANVDEQHLPDDEPKDVSPSLQDVLSSFVKMINRMNNNE